VVQPAVRGRRHTRDLADVLHDILGRIRLEVRVVRAHQARIARPQERVDQLVRGTADLIVAAARDAGDEQEEAAAEEKTAAKTKKPAKKK